MSPKLIYLVTAIRILCSGFVGCKQTDDNRWKRYGYFGHAKYFDKNDIGSGYFEIFIIKIEAGSVTRYGTVQTWGSKYEYDYPRTKDTILVEGHMRIYNSGDTAICYEYSANDSLYKEVFLPMPALAVSIGEHGIISKRLGQVLANLQFAGEYHYQNQLVEFGNDGTVLNFDKFKKYAVRPRLGTLTYRDNRIIETDNGIWKFSKEQGDLTLTKYTEERDDDDIFILSNEKVVLKKVN
jgi:hypothetical protein